MGGRLIESDQPLAVLATKAGVATVVTMPVSGNRATRRKQMQSLRTQRRELAIKTAVAEMRRERKNALARLKRRMTKWRSERQSQAGESAKAYASAGNWHALLDGKPGTYEIMLDLGTDFDRTDDQHGVHTAVMTVGYGNIQDEYGYWIPFSWLKRSEDEVRESIPHILDRQPHHDFNRIFAMWWFLRHALEPLIAERQAAREARSAARKAEKTAE